MNPFLHFAGVPTGIDGRSAHPSCVGILTHALSGTGEALIAPGLLARGSPNPYAARAVARAPGFEVPRCRGAPSGATESKYDNYKLK